MNPAVKGTGWLAETGFTVSRAPSGREERISRKHILQSIKVLKGRKCHSGAFPTHTSGDSNHAIRDHLFISLYPFGKP